MQIILKSSKFFGAFSWKRREHNMETRLKKKWRNSWKMCATLDQSHSKKAFLYLKLWYKRHQKGRHWESSLKLSQEPKLSLPIVLNNRFFSIVRESWILVPKLFDNMPKYKNERKRFKTMITMNKYILNTKCSDLFETLFHGLKGQMCFRMRSGCVLTCKSTYCHVFQWAIFHTGFLWDICPLIQNL